MTFDPRQFTNLAIFPPLGNFELRALGIVERLGRGPEISTRTSNDCCRQSRRKKTELMRLGCILLALFTVATATSAALADEKVERRRAALLQQMRSLAEQTEVRYVQGKGEPELVKFPVFRYDDQPRRFIDATMWVWTAGGRPVAFQKIEAKHHPGRDPQWGYCFSSVSPNLLAVKWSEERNFQSKEPGINFQPLTDAPAVAETSTQRKRQAREMSRTFSARVVTDPKNNISQEMRLLTTPIFEYVDPDSKEYRGAVFGFSTNGTNPDALVLLEVGGKGDAQKWHYAVARMTSGGVTLKYRSAKVWETTWVNWNEAPFPTWTFYDVFRKPVPDEE